ncbi:MAG: PD40 domain-containing protein [Candidatus Aminicenantes bacterium]|nr:PD40 domain-containing protein [Candidatus Aminicenantes bacterium]
MMMKPIIVLSILSIFMFGISHEHEKSEDFLVLKGPYLGQKPPGMIPEIFAPRILNTEKTGAFCTVFSPDGNEFYFVYYKRAKDTPGGLAYMKKINNIWTKPKMLHFNSPTYDNDMCISADGKKLIFRSWRALPDGKKPKDHSYLWIVARSKHDWKEAEPLLCGGEPVRTGYPSISQKGTIYFAHRRNNRLGIFCSRQVNNEYMTPEFVYTVFNQDFIHGDMFIDPDESYMIVSGRDPKGKIGYGLLDLYIVFRKSDGTWIRAINMGKSINTKSGENCPQVSPDGKYFFFNRYNPDIKRGNMYWVDASIIDDLKPNGLK